MSAEHNNQPEPLMIKLKEAATPFDHSKEAPELVSKATRLAARTAFGEGIMTRSASEKRE